MAVETLHERLTQIVGDRSAREVAALTGHHAETVRRYLRGQRPTFAFLAQLALELDVSLHWLVTGAPPRAGGGSTLQDAHVGELLAAMLVHVERLAERVDGLERACADRRDAAAEGSAAPREQ